jgi:hypothetical protein
VDQTESDSIGPAAKGDVQVLQTLQNNVECLIPNSAALEPVFATDRR